MKVLVVTPTLGRSPWLEQTVASVGAFGSECTQLLVAPPAMVAALERRFPQCVVVEEQGSGMYAAINAALEKASDWTFFTYLNDDDVLLPGFAKVVRAVRARPARALIVYGSVRLVGADGRRLGSIPVSPWPALNRRLYAERIEPVYQHGTVVTRAVVEQIGAFDAGLRFCGDSEFFARACTRGVLFHRVFGPAVAAFRLRPGQLTKNRQAMNTERIAVDEALGLLKRRGEGGSRWARILFRLANAPVYLERMARFGFVSFDDILERVG